MQAKTYICKALIIFVDIDINKQLSELLAAFRKEYKHQKDHKKDHIDADSNILQKHPMFHNPNAFAWFRAYNYSDEEFVYLLMDLSEYEEPHLRVAAIKLLTMSFNQKGEILKVGGLRS
jgi:hypothetical protein